MTECDKFDKECLACKCAVKNSSEKVQKKCRNYIDYPEDNNCCLVSIEKYGDMTLREVAERLDLTWPRIKQLEDRAIKKLYKRMKRRDITPHNFD